MLHSQCEHRSREGFFYDTSTRIFSYSQHLNSWIQLSDGKKHSCENKWPLPRINDTEWNRKWITGLSCSISKLKFFQSNKLNYTSLCVIESSLFHRNGSTTMRKSMFIEKIKFCLLILGTHLSDSLHFLFHRQYWHLMDLGWWTETAFTWHIEKGKRFN